MRDETGELKGRLWLQDLMIPLKRMQSRKGKIFHLNAEFQRIVRRDK